MGLTSAQTVIDMAPESQTNRVLLMKILRMVLGTNSRFIQIYAYFHHIKFGLYVAKRKIPLCCFSDSIDCTHMCCKIIHMQNVSGNTLLMLIIAYLSCIMDVGAEATNEESTEWLKCLGANFLHGPCIDFCPDAMADAVEQQIRIECNCQHHKFLMEFTFLSPPPNDRWLSPKTLIEKWKSK